MVSKVIRLHLQRASLGGILRIAAGWGIALTGFVLLLMQLHQWPSTLPLGTQNALAGGAVAAAATALGALPVLVMRRIPVRLQDTLLGFGAGVMLAASMFSLLVPGFESAMARGASHTMAAFTVATGLALGTVLLLALDRALPHTHAPGEDRSSTAVWLFVFAIAVHNIPEGLAIGVASGEAGTGNAVTTGIALQNVPEGLIVAIALASAGYGRLLSFIVAALSGLVEPVAAVLGSLMVEFSAMALPWGLSAAAGAMLFVVSHEIIPESHRRGHETLATAGLITGFIIMMLLDSLL